MKLPSKLQEFYSRLSKKYKRKEKLDNLLTPSTDIKISRVLKFEQERDNRWYVVLPEWNGSKDDLEMVYGADVLLSYLSKGKNEISLSFSEETFDDCDIFKFFSKADDIGSGAYYVAETYNGNNLNLYFWLCDVTLFIFNKFPQIIYYKVV